MFGGLFVVWCLSNETFKFSTVHSVVWAGLRVHPSFIETPIKVSKCIRRITLVRGPIWGIHSLTMIISCFYILLFFSLHGISPKALSKRGNRFGDQNNIMIKQSCWCCTTGSPSKETKCVTMIDEMFVVFQIYQTRSNTIKQGVQTGKCFGY